MKRYTSYSDRWKCYVVDNNKLDTEQEQMDYCDTYESIYAGGAINKLAEYENAEEEGLLLRLPCRPGDVVYVVGTKCLSGLYEFECDLYDAETDCPCHLDNEWIVFKKETDIRFLAELIMKKNTNFILGETVFTNSDEAFYRLAEITKRNDCGGDEYDKRKQCQNW